MQIYADPITINCRKVLAGLKLMEADHRLQKVDYFQAEQKNDDYLAINPNAALPALKDGDLVLWESNAMLQYAADKHGKNEYYPTDPKQRADVNRWLFGKAPVGFQVAMCMWLKTVSNPSWEINLIVKFWQQRLIIFTSLPASLITGCRVIAGFVVIHRLLLTLPLPHRCTCTLGSKLPLDNHANLVRWMTEEVEQLQCWKDTHVGEGFTV